MLTGFQPTAAARCTQHPVVQCMIDFKQALGHWQLATKPIAVLAGVVSCFCRWLQLLCPVRVVAVSSCRIVTSNQCTDMQPCWYPHSHTKRPTRTPGGPCAHTLEAQRAERVHMFEEAARLCPVLYCHNSILASCAVHSMPYYHL